eukprot:GHRQ01004964.1.p2 GENE.GHRQ01004964.1~~GHRQ01004964.1.p2  ORF type:complete len:167 (+),score=11.24 GHRQ01004964.1:2246-2746(+)
MLKLLLPAKTQQVSDQPSAVWQTVVVTAVAATAGAWLSGAAAPAARGYDQRLKIGNIAWSALPHGMLDCCNPASIKQACDWYMLGVANCSSMPPCGNMHTSHGVTSCCPNAGGQPACWPMPCSAHLVLLQVVDRWVVREGSVMLGSALLHCSGDNPVASVGCSRGH